MQAKAFVLITVDLGAERQVAEALRAVENVAEVHSIYGIYDIVALVQADTAEKVKHTITWKIRKLDKIRSTLTMVVVESSQV